MDENLQPGNGTVWQPATKQIVGVGLALFGLFVLVISRSVLPLLVTAALLAFILSPVINRLQRRPRISRPGAVALVYLLVILLLLAIPFTLTSQAINMINFLLALDYQALIADIVASSENTLMSIQALTVPVLDSVIDNLIGSMLNALQGANALQIPEASSPSPQSVFQALFTAFMASYGIAIDLVGFVASGALALVFFVMASIYFLLDGHKFMGAFIEAIPPKYRPEFEALIKRIRLVWEGFFRGQVALMLIIGTVVWLGGTAIGLPFAFVLGILAGILEIVPNLGPALATIPSVVVALILGPTYYGMNHIVFALIVIGFYVLVQFLENSIVVPNVMGEAVDLHPLVILTGVFVGAATWGILGALLAAPVIATVKEIVGYLYYKLAWEEPATPYDQPQEEPPKLLDRVRGLLTHLVPRRSKSKAQKTEKLVIPGALETQPPAQRVAISGMPEPAPAEREPELLEVEREVVQGAEISGESGRGLEVPKVEPAAGTAASRQVALPLALISLAGLVGGIFVLLRREDGA